MIIKFKYKEILNSFENICNYILLIIKLLFNTINFNFFTFFIVTVV